MLRARHARIGVWTIALIPTAIFLAGVDAQDVASAAAVFNLLGRLTGVIGLALLLLAAALSARVPGFDQPFGGLTKLWHTHHLLGAGSLMLLLVHPIFLAIGNASNGTSIAILTLFPPLSDWATWSGWLALVLMMVFLAPSFSFFGRPRYEQWKRIHALAGPAVILALIHTSQFSRSMPGHLDILIWSLLAVLAVSAVAWRFVFSRRAARLKHTVKAVTPVANNVVELTLQPEGSRLKYAAGNFVYLTPFDKQLKAGRGEEHPYTLSSSPLEPDLRIAIKDLGDASRAIQSIRPGTRVTVEGPYGRFFIDGDQVSSPELWVAGGIGITPFLARMRHLKSLGKPADIHLIFAVQDEARALYAQELKQLASEIPGFVLTLHQFYQQGPVSEEFLRSHCPDYARRHAYICGPLPLNKLVQSHLRNAGVPIDRIHTEEFELL